jgi:hypothetical protein
MPEEDDNQISVSLINLWLEHPVTRAFMEEVKSAKKRCNDYIRSAVREDAVPEANFWVGQEDALQLVLDGPEALKARLLDKAGNGDDQAAEGEEVDEG